MALVNDSVQTRLLIAQHQHLIGPLACPLACRAAIPFLVTIVALVPFAVPLGDLLVEPVAAQQ